MLFAFLVCSDLAAEKSAADTFPHDRWIYSATVTFNRYHDPSVICLTDGRELMVHFTKLTWQQVDQWPIGRRLMLAYSSQTGAVLIDTETQETMPVIDGFGDRHPLNELLDRDLKNTVTTIDIVRAYETSITLWQKEIERLYHLYLESDQISSDGKEAVRSEQALWGKFQEAHVRVAGYLCSLPPGSIWSLKNVEHHHGLVVEQAHRLQDLVYPVVSAGRQRTM